MSPWRNLHHGAAHGNKLTSRREKHQTEQILKSWWDAAVTQCAKNFRVSFFFFFPFGDYWILDKSEESQRMGDPFILAVYWQVFDSLTAMTSPGISAVVSMNNNKKTAVAICWMGECDTGRREKPFTCSCRFTDVFRCNLWMRAQHSRRWRWI